MKKNDVVLGTVIYPGALLWREEFISSVNKQSYKDFEVLIINDGVEEWVLKEIQDSICHKVLIESASKGTTPIENRRILLRKAKELGYEILVLADFDDAFSEDRINKIMKGYDQNFAFYYHNIKYGDEKVLFKELPRTVNSISSIMQANFLGMSNTAINIDCIEYEWIESLQELATGVFDWYLFSRLVLSGGSGKLIDGNMTFYRLHDNNIAGIAQGSRSDLEQEVFVKLEHYSKLKNICEKYEILFEKYKNIDVTEWENTTNAHGYWWGFINLEV